MRIKKRGKAAGRGRDELCPLAVVLLFSDEAFLSSFAVCSYLKHHARLLQQIRPHVGADDAVATVEADLDVFPKTTAVVVACCLCIPDGLRDRRQQIGDNSFLALDVTQTGSEPATLTRRLYCSQAGAGGQAQAAATATASAAAASVSAATDGSAAAAATAATDASAAAADAAATDASAASASGPLSINVREQSTQDLLTGSEHSAIQVRQGAFQQNRYSSLPVFHSISHTHINMHTHVL